MLLKLMLRMSLPNADYVTSGSWRGVVSAAISVAPVPLVLSSKKFIALISRKRIVA